MEWSAKQGIAWCWQHFARMVNGRFPGRALIFLVLLVRFPLLWLRRKPAPKQVRRVLVLHQLLLGDALMATSLLAKLRQQFPQAQLMLACPPGQVALYRSQPYGLRALAWHPRDFASIWRLLLLAKFDCVYLVGENRLGFLARALGARWVVGFAGERSSYKSLLVDQLIPYSGVPTAWSDTAATLVEGPAPRPFQLSDWPLDPLDHLTLPERYAVLHVGASSRTRFWPSEHWRALASELRVQGARVLWSCGPGERHLIAAVQPHADDVVQAGCLTLPQLRAVLARARVCISTDTGVAHLAKVAGAPLLMLFGPGSETLFGASYFFANSPCLGVGPALFPCRNQARMLQRPVAWVQRCHRPAGEGAGACAKAQCMAAISVADVLGALLMLSRAPLGACDPAPHCVPARGHLPLRRRVVGRSLGGALIYRVFSSIK